MRIVPVLVAFASLSLAGCDPTGACEEPPGMNKGIPPICLEGAKKSSCTAPHVFQEGKACQALGYHQCGDDKHMLMKPCWGACVGKVKPDYEPTPGNPREFCIEDQSEAQCTEKFPSVEYAFNENKSCKDLGFPTVCPANPIGDKARYKACPTGSSAPSASPPK